MGFLVTLGDTRCERFSMVVGKDEGFSIYPYANNGSVRTRTMGPDNFGKGKRWLIDGRNARVPTGSVYQVRLCWGKPMSVTWELTDARCTDADAALRRTIQSYQ